MAGLDLTSFDGALKTHYTDDRVENMTFKRRPFLALCPKMENFGGKNGLPIPIIYANPQGRSRDFVKAQTRGGLTTTQIKDFILTRKKDYSIATIDNEALEASKGDENSFMDAATTEIDGVINSLTQNLAISLTRKSSGAIGQVNVEPTETSTTFSLTLKTLSDHVNYELGQNLVIWSAESGGSQRNCDGTATTFPIVAINRNTGVLTMTGTYSSSGTIAANDYIYVDGDRGASISGLEDWIPSTDPDSTLFFGVDRSVDVTRLGGHRLDGTTLPIEEALIEADARVADSGWALDHFFMNPRKIGDLKKALGTKVQYANLQANPHVSFTAVMVDGANGPIKCVGDQSFPTSRIFGLMMEMWKLYSLGKAVRVLDTDGLQMLRQGAADGVEVRYGYYANLGCRGPGANINIQV